MNGRVADLSKGDAAGQQKTHPFQKQRKRLPVDNQMVVDQSMGAVGGQDFRMVEDELADHMSLVSQTTSSKGKILLHKLCHCQNTIAAKATDISNAIAHPEIEKNPRAVSKAGIV